MHWGEGAAGILRNLTSSFGPRVLLPWAGLLGLKSWNPPGLDAAPGASSDQLSALSSQVSKFPPGLRGSWEKGWGQSGYQSEEGVVAA